MLLFIRGMNSYFLFKRVHLPRYTCVHVRHWSLHNFSPLVSSLTASRQTSTQKQSYYSFLPSCTIPLLIRPVCTWARLNPYQSHASTEVWDQMWSAPSIHLNTFPLRNRVIPAEWNIHMINCTSSIHVQIQCAVVILAFLYKKLRELLSKGTTDEASIKETKEAWRSKKVAMVQTLYG